MKYPKEDIISSLKNAKGVISVAAKSLGCERKTIYNRMEEDEDIQDARESAQAGMIDEAENRLHNLITSPDHKDHYKAIRYYLTTQGRERGYGDKLDVTSKGEKIDGFKVIRDES